MILVLSNSADATADFACNRLAAEEFEHVRLDTDELAKQVSLSMACTRLRLHADGREVAPEDVSGVLFRRPRTIRVVAEDASEAMHATAEWTEALEGFLACVPVERWINHPTRSAVASHKVEQILRAQRLGLSVPETLITQDPAQARSFAERQTNVVVKALSGGYIERASGDDSHIYTSRLLPEHHERLDLVKHCPTLLQAEVSKSLDVRVTAVDDRLTAVGLHKSDDHGAQITDIRRDNWRGVRYERVAIPDVTARPLRTMLAQYHLRFAAIDFAVDLQGRWLFLEVNTGGQWAWLDMEAGTDIAGDLSWALKNKP